MNAVTDDDAAILARVKALTTAEALDLLSHYQQITEPMHREAVRKLARTLASIETGRGLYKATP